MSDHDTWNMFAAHALGGYIASERAWGSTEDEWRKTAERIGKAADALLAESKKRGPVDELDTLESAISTPPQPDDDGWIKWEGGECPVGRETYVEVRLRMGEENIDCASEYRWSRRDVSDDIVKYRIVSEAGVTK